MLTSESIGFLDRGVADDEVIKELGTPQSKSKAVVWAADGAEHQSWYYFVQGIELDMLRD